MSMGPLINDAPELSLFGIKGDETNLTRPLNEIFEPEIEFNFERKIWSNEVANLDTRCHGERSRVCSGSRNPHSARAREGGAGTLW